MLSVIMRILYFYALRLLVGNAHVCYELLSLNLGRHICPVYPRVDKFRLRKGLSQGFRTVESERGASRPVKVGIALSHSYDWTGQAALRLISSQIQPMRSTDWNHIKCSDK